MKHYKIVKILIFFITTSGAFAAEGSTLPLVKLNRLKVTLFKELTLHRRVVKHSSIVDKVTFSAFFQAGKKIQEKEIQSGVPFCLLEKSPVFIGGSAYQYKEFADKHSQESEKFQTFSKKILNVSAYPVSDINPNESLQGFKYDFNATILIYFEENHSDKYQYAIDLTCVKNGSDVTIVDVEVTTGNAFEVTQVPLPKGGMTEVQLRQKWEQMRELFANGHTPIEAELRIGQTWDCEQIALERMFEGGPAEFSYNVFPKEKLLEKDERMPGTYTDGMMLYNPYKEGLISKWDGFFETYRTSKNLLIREFAETLTNPFSNEERDQDLPDALVTSGLKALSYSRCTP